MTTDTDRAAAKRVLVALADAIVSTVHEVGPYGAPAGSLYAAMMAHGMSLEQFNQFMSALVKVGRLRKRGHLYFAD